jgi:hypothetical protein
LSEAAIRGKIGPGKIGNIRVLQNGMYRIGEQIVSGERT